MNIPLSSVRDDNAEPTESASLLYTTLEIDEELSFKEKVLPKIIIKLFVVKKRI